MFLCDQTYTGLLTLLWNSRTLRSAVLLLSPRIFILVDHCAWCRFTSLHSRMSVTIGFASERSTQLRDEQS